MACPEIFRRVPGLSGKVVDEWLANNFIATVGSKDGGSVVKSKLTVPSGPDGDGEQIPLLRVYGPEALIVMLVALRWLLQPALAVVLA